MSIARGFPNAGHFYSNIVKPIKIDCNFVVDSTNGNGLGIRSLKSNGYVRNVFMNTSASFTGTSHTSTLIDGISGGTSSLQVGMPVQGSGIPAGDTIASIVSSSSITLTTATSSSTTGSITYQGINDKAASPNPAAGYALIQLKQNFNYYLGGFSGFVSPTINTTTAVTSGLTIGNPYIITVLGTTTLAEWQSIGLPAGLVPTVGQSFIAIATGTGGSHTGKVGTPSVSGISSIEVIGDPNQSINNSSIAVNGGAYLLVQFLGGSFTGSALATHTHNFIVKGGQAASTTNDIADYAGPIIGKQAATDSTYLGSASATNGGVVATSAGTPSGTLSLGPVAPANNSVVGMSFFFDGSSVTVDGL